MRNPVGGCPSLRMNPILDKSYSPCSEGYSRAIVRHRDKIHQWIGTETSFWRWSSTAPQSRIWAAIIGACPKDDPEDLDKHYGCSNLRSDAKIGADGSILVGIGTYGSILGRNCEPIAG